MSGTKGALEVDKSRPGHWRVTLDNPPINVIDDAMYDAFYDLVGAVETDAALKVITFESANPDFFIAHYGSRRFIFVPTPAATGSSYHSGSRV